jgi:DNA-binding LacI/PurR family transcriptional regulator
MDLQRLLQEEGHTVTFPGRSISEMGSEVARLAKQVEETRADAWVVTAGPREVLSWFAGTSIPTFALFGRRHGLPLASIGPDKGTAYRSLVRHLARLGHRRIALLTTDGDPYFEMQRPTIAHIRWDSRPWVRRIVQWANGVSQGKIDRRQSLTKAEFVEGVSVGRAAGG